MASMCQRLDSTEQFLANGLYAKREIIFPDLTEGTG